MDVFGLALRDQFTNNAQEILWLHNTYGEPEEMPLDVFFRNESEMPEMEIIALKQCRGNILDIGAGVGSHALLIQQAGYNVTAIEISVMACTIMQQRGVKQIVNSHFLSYNQGKYDTLLLLMNGIGIAETTKKLPAFLKHCSQLLKPGGQIIFDSSDISYLYDDIPLPTNNYFGEVSYQYKYQNQTGDWFDWLYIDKDKLTAIAVAHNFNVEILFEDKEDQYLARLTAAK